MDEIQENQQPISDDQDLAKALAGISDIEPETDMDFAGAPPSVADIHSQIAISDGTAADGATTPVAAEVVPEVMPEIIPEVIPEVLPEAPGVQAEEATSASNNTLDSVLTQAVEDLRPLVGKLDLPPEEKFETYLLLIRSSDDKNLIAPAYEAAKQIPDETKRAEALLDIIKEAEYLKEA